jgi:hypothetical protein
VQETLAKIPDHLVGFRVWGLGFRVLGFQGATGIEGVQEALAKIPDLVGPGVWGGLQGLGQASGLGGWA